MFYAIIIILMIMALRATLAGQIKSISSELFLLINLI